MQHKEPLGFASVAINSTDTDYLRLAYLQALNIKATQRNNRYAVIVDSSTLNEITDTHRKVFDHVIQLPDSDLPAQTQEPLIFWMTPFKETIKLESDLLLPRSIDHWIHAFRLRDVCMSHGCRDYLGKISQVRKYRDIFDQNHLPDLYNGLMYFRFSATAAKFFQTARLLVDNWSLVSQQLTACDEITPSTDVLYSLTAHIMGEDLCSIPSMEFINFIHLKPGIQGWNDSRSVFDTVISEIGDTLRVNNTSMLHPVHYYDKHATFIPELTKYYESSRT